MKTLYLDLSMGAAGDMLAAALLELIDDKDAFLNEVNALMPGDVTVTAESSVKCGITGTHLHVLAGGVEEDETLHEHHHDHDEHEHHHDHGDEHDHEDGGHEHHHDHEEEHDHDHDEEHHHHHHAALQDILDTISSFTVADSVKENAKAVYQRLGEAEAYVHDKPLTDIHFHEVGTKDAIADITMVSMLLDRIHPDRIVASPICTGYGHVHCAHGILPVPAPATARLLTGIPVYAGHIASELCTPTGAALVGHFADAFGEMPLMTMDRIGYGMGKKDFEQANCVRAILGSADESRDEIIELRCNIDDMTAEELAFAQERILAAGAVDVTMVPCTMKKSRPGTLVEVLTKEAEKDKVIAAMFRHTTTLGIREARMNRYVLTRTNLTVEQNGVSAGVKKASGYGTEHSKVEFEDLARIARERDISLFEARELLK